MFENIKFSVGDKVDVEINGYHWFTGEVMNILYGENVRTFDILEVMVTEEGPDKGKIIGVNERVCKLAAFNNS